MPSGGSVWYRDANGNYRPRPSEEVDVANFATMVAWHSGLREIVETTTKTFLAGSAGAGYKPTILERIKNAFRR